MLKKTLKEKRKEVLVKLIDNAENRAKTRARFLGEMEPLLETLSGVEKWWLFKELSRSHLGNSKVGEVK